MNLYSSILLADLDNGSKIILEVAPNSYSQEDIEKLRQGIHNLRIKSYLQAGFADVLRDSSKELSATMPLPKLPTPAEFKELYR